MPAILAGEDYGIPDDHPGPPEGASYSQQQAECPGRAAEAADRRQRHPGLLGSGRLGLIVVAVLVAYFYYSATAEERNLAAALPAAYPAYKSRTKTLIPFLL